MVSFRTIFSDFVPLEMLKCASEIAAAKLSKVRVFFCGDYFRNDTEQYVTYFTEFTPKKRTVCS